MTTSAPRLTPLPLGEWTDEQRALMSGRMPSTDRFLADENAPRLPNILGFFAHHPAVTGPWLAMSSDLNDAALLSARDRELVILRVSWRTACAYEWGQHFRLGRAAGLTDHELTDVSLELAAGDWSLRDRTLLAVADQLVAEHRVDDATWAQLEEQLDVPETVELLFVVGSYLALAVVLNTVELAPDPGSDTPVPATAPMSEA